MSAARPVIGVVAVIERDGRYLLIQRSATVAAPLSWAFPGGAIEPGEDEPAALVREMHEELGVRVRPGQRVWTWRREHPPLELHCWTAELLDGELRPNPAEVADVRWLTHDEIRALPGLLPSCIDLLNVMAS